MTRKEFLLEKYKEIQANYFTSNKAFFTSPSVAYIKPFKIADNLFYVGDKKVCIHLIDTGDGLVLLDSGYLGATHLLVDSIWRAGFDPASVRWILHTHGHSDHFGASIEFRNLYGTKLAISRVDAESLREKEHRAHVNHTLYPLAQTPKFDYEIEDGEIFEIGKTKIRCVLTPGHTAGVLSFFFEVTDNGQTYLAGTFGGAGINALRLPYICYNEDDPDIPEQMLASIQKIWNEPVQIHLGNHPYNNRTFEKLEKQLKEGGNPFIDSASWHLFLQEQIEKTKNVIEYNRQLQEEMDELFPEQSN